MYSPRIHVHTYIHTGETSLVSVLVRGSHVHLTTYSYFDSVIFVNIQKQLHKQIF